MVSVSFLVVGGVVDAAVRVRRRARPRRWSLWPSVRAATSPRAPWRCRWDTPRLRRGL